MQYHRSTSVASAALAISTAACLSCGIAMAQTPFEPAVRTMVVEPPAQDMTRQFFGRVTARETVDLSFDVGGTMTLLVPEEGQQVNAGDLLAELDLDPFARSVERAELSVEMATRDAGRAATLAASQAGAVTRAEDAATAREMAAVALRDAQAALEDATLRSPFDGLVAVHIMPAFSALAPGQPVLRLHDLSEVRVEFAMPERLFQQVGSLKAIGFMAVLPDGSEAPLRLVAFQPQTDAIGQSYRVTLAFQDPPPGILPGASVTVRASVPATTPGVVVPAAALLAGNDREAAVLTLAPSGDAFLLQRQPVTIIARDGSAFTVEGLPAGTEIVSAGAHLLDDGQTVRRFTGLTTAEE
jgi:membrane fusion protein, multidrug efflux system